MKTICLITDGTLPVPPVLGGAVENLIQFLINQNELEHKVKFVVCSVANEDAEAQSRQYKHTKFIYLPANTKIENIVENISRLINKFFKITWKNEVVCYSAYYKKIIKLLNEINPDYLVCEGSSQLAKFSIFNKIYNSEKLYVHLHGNWFPSKLVSNTFEHVIGVSDFISKEYLSTCSNKNVKVDTVYNCINNLVFEKRFSKEERNKKRQELGFNKEDFVIVFCGRICKEKGVLELVQAVLNCRKNIKLLILGSLNFGENIKDSYVEEVSELSKKSQGKVVYSGYVKNTDVWQYHQCADCFTMPSLWEEPGALSLIEGMTSGLPLVVTNSGGTHEQINEEFAIEVCKEGNVIEGLKKAFESLESDRMRCQKMGKKAEKFSKKYSQEKFYNDYIDCFDGGHEE